MIVLGIVLFVVCFEFYAYTRFRQLQSTLVLYNVCNVFVLTLLFFLYFSRIAQSDFLKRYIQGFPIVLLLSGLVNHFLWQPFFHTYQSYTYLMAAMGLVLFCCLYFWEIVRYNRYIDVPLYAIPHFWNIAAILAYYAATFLYAMSVTSFLGVLSSVNPSLAKALAVLNQTFAAFLYLVLGFSYWIVNGITPVRSPRARSRV